MSGVSVIYHLISEDPALAAAFPTIGVYGGMAPLNTDPPIVIVRLIGGNPQLTVAERSGARRLMEDRVQASVKAVNYDDVTDILALILPACKHRSIPVNGIDVVSITPDIESPDLPDPALGIFERSRDFIVKWRTAPGAFSL